MKFKCRVSVGKLRFKYLKLEKKSKSQLMRQADTLFSEYVRKQKMDFRGGLNCYTCSKYLEYSKSQCGHYFPRSVMNLRYDERNVRTQCASCNVFKHGNYTVYAANLLREVGRKEFDQLEKDSKVKVKTTKQWYIDIINDLKEKLNDL